jgi:hypothetical protein
LKKFKNVNVSELLQNLTYFENLKYFSTWNLKNKNLKFRKLKILEFLKIFNTFEKFAKQDISEMLKKW